ncbi:MAG TPA: GNAT family protein [Candidatus Baltobacteraceae bacterium]|jgi:ribosomal-protein-serine acetyltransferase|nr:GNAT family protein [Candidatus Baltobacteraceae bacterium]
MQQEYNPELFVDIDLPLSPGTRLRAIRPSDACALYPIVEKERAYLAEWLAWAPACTLESLEAFLQVAHDDMLKGSSLVCGIEQDGALIGMISIDSIDRVNLRAHFGYWLSQEHHGKGIMTASLRTLLDYGFNRLGLHRLVVEAAETNLRSRNVAERAEMHLEATLRDRFRLNDTWHNGVLYVALNPVNS